MSLILTFCVTYSGTNVINSVNLQGGEEVSHASQSDAS